MTLSIENVKLQTPERTTGNTGGRMSGNELVDGQLNNLFPNLTTVDFTAGGVYIGKCYAWVNSNNVDQLRGAYAVLTKPPTNPDVTVAMLTTRNWFDYIDAHRAHLSNYLSIGPRINWIPAEGGAVQGSLQIQVWGGVDTPKPEIGNTYFLVYHEGLVDEVREAIKVVDLTHTVEQFEDEKGTFYKRIVNMRLAAEINQTYTGTTMARYAAGALPTSLHSTIAAGASRVWGVMKLASPILQGDTSFSVESIYTQIVPASISETLATDQTAAGRSLVLIPGMGGNVSFEYVLDIGPGYNLYLGQPAQIGSVSIVAGPSTLSEIGGNLYSGGALVANIDHEHGIILPVTGSPTYTGSKTVSFSPSGAIAQPLSSSSILVTLTNQGRVWSFNIPTRPTKGSIVINYMAGGQWYELRDNGTTIVGSSTDYGSASLSSLNTLSMSFGTAPDVDSRIIIYWGVDVYTLDQSASLVPKAKFEINTAVALTPLTVGIEWTDSEGAKVALDDGSGALTGDATGTVYYAKKQIVIQPNRTPTKGTVFTVSVTPRLSATEVFTQASITAGDVVVSGGMASFTTAHFPIIEKSIWMIYEGLRIPGQVKKTGYSVPFYTAIAVGHTVTENVLTDGSTNWRDNGSGGFTSGFAGSVNYATGEFSVDATPTIAASVKQDWDYGVAAPGGAYAGTSFVGWSYEPKDVEFGEGWKATLTYLYDDVLTAVIEYHAASVALIDFLPNTGGRIVPGSLRFTWCGKTVMEQNGALYADVSTATGSGVLVGTLDLAGRRASMTTWIEYENSPQLISLLTRLSDDILSEITIKVPSPPIKTGGFTVRATQLDGTMITATVGGDGSILDVGMYGKVWYEMGVAHVRFGDWVTAAGNEGEPWYQALNVVGGQVFKPAPVFAQSVVYDATLQSRSALPADVIEIETATLPSDGKLEVVRARDMLYLHDDDSITVTTPSDGEAFDCGRTALERIWVKDATGLAVPPTKYTATDAELDAGVCHWANPLNLDGYTTPLTVYHRISETRTVGVVGRFGTCRLRDLPFSRDYPAGAFISSMLYMGHLFADWSVPEFKQTWQSWATAGTGNDAAAAYDYGNFPFTVKNNGVTVKCRVAFVFQTTTTFRCLLEGFGQIDSNIPITADYAPINPATGQPYFTITGNHDGDEPWGEGWAVLNYVLFELQPSSFPIEPVRCVMPSDPVTGMDSATIEIHGNFG
jgi:hypothetical protein